MNDSELSVELARNKLSIPKAADMICIGKKAFYSKMKGETEFKQSEIKGLKKLLNLSDERVGEFFLLIKFLKRNKIKSIGQSSLCISLKRRCFYVEKVCPGSYT